MDINCCLCKDSLDPMEYMGTNAVVSTIIGQQRHSWSESFRFNSSVIETDTLHIVSTTRVLVIE